MENPLAWDDMTKKVYEIFQKFDEDLKNKVIGHSIYFRIARFVDSEVEKAKNL